VEHEYRERRVNKQISIESKRRLAALRDPDHQTAELVRASMELLLFNEGDASDLLALVAVCGRHAAKKAGLENDAALRETVNVMEAQMCKHEHRERRASRLTAELQPNKLHLSAALGRVRSKGRGLSRYGRTGAGGTEGSYRRVFWRSYHTHGWRRRFRNGQAES
jgi:hypothetical protein